jgi:hypothetical protein
LPVYKTRREDGGREGGREGGKEGERKRGSEEGMVRKKR